MGIEYCRWRMKKVVEGTLSLNIHAEEYNIFAEDGADEDIIDILHDFDDKKVRITIEEI